jgi:hypothetical protein
MSMLRSDPRNPRNAGRRAALANSTPLSRRKHAAKSAHLEARLLRALLTMPGRRHADLGASPVDALNAVNATTMKVRSAEVVTPPAGTVRRLLRAMQRLVGIRPAQRAKQGASPAIGCTEAGPAVSIDSMQDCELPTIESILVRARALGWKKSPPTTERPQRQVVFETSPVALETDRALRQPMSLVSGRIRPPDVEALASQATGEPAANPAPESPESGSSLLSAPASALQVLSASSALSATCPGDCSRHSIPFSSLSVVVVA